MSCRAESGDKEAPTIIWLQGGPGCSSLLGMLYENGPWHLHEGHLVENKHRWTKHFNMLYVDNPVGAGYSYVEKEDGYVVDEPSMARELLATVKAVFEAHADKLGTSKTVMLGGESYAGKYIPALTHAILEDAEAKKLIRLSAVAMGNGMTDPVTQLDVYADYAYNVGLVDEQVRDELRGTQKEILESIGKHEYQTAWQDWDGLVNKVIRHGGHINAFDIRSFHKFDVHPAQRFFNRNSTKVALGVPAGHAYRGCSRPAYHHLEEDMMKSVKHLVPPILKAGVRVLVYNGQFDFVVPVPSSNAWVTTIDWPGAKEFLAARRKVWRIGERVAAYTRRHENLTQLIVVGAGHMVPMNQPEVAFRMMKRFAEGEGW